jgi:hypothetical protein
MLPSLSVAKTRKFLLEHTSISFIFDYFNTSKTKLMVEKKSAKKHKKRKSPESLSGLDFLDREMVMKVLNV